MVFLSDAASACKNRFGFSSDHPPELSNSSFLIRSASRENMAHFQALEARNSEDHEDVSSSAAALSSSRGQGFELCEDPSFWKDHNVQVIIRIRPLSGSEISVQGSNKCVRQDSSQTVTWTGHPESRFTFDVVADENVSQEELFKIAGVPMVENCVGGYNSCMFAYGQTGSGKTHTMLGDIEGGTRRHSVNCGMTPRVFEYLFSRIQKEKEARKDEKLRFTCKCSFLEIYNEQILDLLDPSINNLQIREDIKKGVYVENLKEVEVTCAREVILQLIQGAANRKVAATNMNRASSRSHSVFTCVIESKWEAQGVTHHRFARLNLVDLAGSERQKSSGAEGERLKEATNINKSLSTLGLVIMNLVSISNGKSLHVPYRDSKLTFLLQDSLGGNAKTIIIANISPSNCCSLETLSTLKFAQRAKFIKNNAIINEDASGDVISMRMQIQQLKKEVARLRGMGNGGDDNVDNDMPSFPTTPGLFKWDGLHESFSPLTSVKRISQKKDYEVALVGALKREKDKEIALHTLVSENQAALQLAKQRADEIQGLKMRLRFREAGIKRLEAVASGKISAEAHLLKEKEEHLKEIEVLRAQVDRSQEVTRFAMENLQLKEEIRRLKSFVEEGERETMKDQISALQNKLLEVLDWKLMHESNLPAAQEPSTPWSSEENEFLRLQIIQNQAELESLRKKLNFCIEEKENLERHVQEIKAERSRRAMEETKAIEHISSSPSRALELNFDDQMELKTMVDAIAAASQKEAKAHENAVHLSKENEELRMKLKVLIDDNNKLIELYEQATAERHDDAQTNVAALNEGPSTEPLESNEPETKAVMENLENQLMEMHEENEKLMSLYEKAMQERDEFKRMLHASGATEAKGEYDCPEKLVEVDAAETNPELEGCLEVMTAKVMQPFLFSESELLKGESGTFKFNARSVPEKCSEDDQSDSGYHLETETPELSSTPQQLVLAKTNLENAELRLKEYASNVAAFALVEKAASEVEEIKGQIEEMRKMARLKQCELGLLSTAHSEKEEMADLAFKKFSALKHTITCFLSSLEYFEQREARAKGRVNDLLSYLSRKKEELSHLQARKDKLESDRMNDQQLEEETKKRLASLKSKLEEEKKRKHENEKVLFAIDNVENMDPSKKTWNLGGKASDLLKSEEEKTKLQTEIGLCQERLVTIRKELSEFKHKHEKISSMIQNVQTEIAEVSKTLDEKNIALQGVMQEKRSLLEVREDGMDETEDVFLLFQQHAFEAHLKEEEIELVKAEMETQQQRIKELEESLAEKHIRLLSEMQNHSRKSREIENQLLTTATMIEETSSLLVTRS